VFVYEATPSGFTPADLRATARHDPGAAVTIALLVTVGVAALAVSPWAPFGWLFVVVGLAAMARGLWRARGAARGSMIRPSLVADGQPRWEGVRRALFTLLADDPEAIAGLIVVALDDECGPGLSDAEGMVTAWGVGRPAALRASGDTCGIWLRRTPLSDDGGSRVDLLADTGAAEATLRQVIGRLEPPIACGP
jgi:hypothetical protein